MAETVAHQVEALQAEAMTEDERSVLAVLARRPGVATPARYLVEWVGPHAGHPTGPTMGKRVAWDQRADAALAGLVEKGLATSESAGGRPAFAATETGLALAAAAKLKPGSAR